MFEVEGDPGIGNGDDPSPPLPPPSDDQDGSGNGNEEQRSDGHDTMETYGNNTTTCLLMGTTGGILVGISLESLRLWLGILRTSL
jgi:hypothetical protein